MNMQVTRAEANNEPFHALEAEQALIAAVLHDNKAYGLVRGRIGPEHFFEHLHARLWEAIGEDIDAGREASYFSLAPRFRDDATMKELGGVRYISSLFLNVITTVNAAGYADKIVEVWRQRESANLAADLAEAIAAGDSGDVAEITAAMQRLNQTEAGGSHKTESAGAAAHHTIEALSEAYRTGGAGNSHARSGFADLSRLIGGWRRGRLYILAGRPGMGKSTFALSAALATAANGHAAMFCALEMGKDELTTMALCSLAWSVSGRVEYREVSPDAVTESGFLQKYEAVHREMPRLSELPLFFSDKGGLTVADIRARAEACARHLAARGKRLEVLFIDHIGLIKATSAYAGNKVAETEEISTALKLLARELDCAVIGLSQLSRQVESRVDKRPNLSDLRWSGAIEQDADVVMFVYREAYYLSKREDDPDKEAVRRQRLEAVRNKIEVIVEKNRGGPTGTVDLFCDIACAVIRDLDRDRRDMP